MQDARWWRVRGKGSASRQLVIARPPSSPLQSGEKLHYTAMKRIAQARALAIHGGHTRADTALSTKDGRHASTGEHPVSGCNSRLTGSVARCAALGPHPLRGLVGLTASSRVHDHMELPNDLKD